MFPSETQNALPSLLSLLLFRRNKRGSPRADELFSLREKWLLATKGTRKAFVCFNSCFMLLFLRNKSIKQELKQGPEVGLRVGNSHFGAAPNLGRSARKFNSYSPTGFPGLKSRFVYLSLFQKLYFINVVFTYALLLYIYRQQH